MKRKGRDTIWPECGAVFNIDKHRKYSIKRKYAPFWFFDAIKQFENHSKVICPRCNHEYKAKEAKIFFFFRSPYLVFVLCILLGLISALVLLMISGKL